MHAVNMSETFWEPVVQRLTLTLLGGRDARKGLIILFRYNVIFPTRQWLLKLVKFIKAII